MKLLPIAILTGLAYVFLNRKISAGQNLVIELNDIAIDLEATKRSLFTRIYYRVRLNLVNSESAAVNVQNIQLQAFSGSTNLGTLTAAQRFSVPGRSNKIVQLDAAISSFGLVTEIVRLIRDASPLSVTIKGVVDTDLGRIPLEFTKSVQMPRL